MVSGNENVQDSTDKNQYMDTLIKRYPKNFDRIKDNPELLTKHSYIFEESIQNEEIKNYLDEAEREASELLVEEYEIQKKIMALVSEQEGLGVNLDDNSKNISQAVLSVFDCLAKQLALDTSKNIKISSYNIKKLEPTQHFLNNATELLLVKRLKDMQYRVDAQIMRNDLYIVRAAELEKKNKKDHKLDATDVAKMSLLKKLVKKLKKNKKSHLSAERRLEDYLKELEIIKLTQEQLQLANERQENIKKDLETQEQQRQEMERSEMARKEFEQQQEITKKALEASSPPEKQYGIKEALQTLLSIREMTDGLNLASSAISVIATGKP